ncbi:MAG: hypothetical protein GY847_17230 [Proteobacteria bacterium]|nr:hypothetical protein [Pseudomonadota bacterium]
MYFIKLFSSALLLSILTMGCEIASRDRDVPELSSDSSEISTNNTDDTDTNGDHTTDKDDIDGGDSSLDDFTVTFRIDSLELLMPKMYTPVMYYPEITTNVNTSLKNSLKQDREPKDGYYDLNLLARFDSIDPDKSGGKAVLLSGLCPIDGSPCIPHPDAKPEQGNYVNHIDGTCMQGRVSAPCVENEPIDTSLYFAAMGTVVLKSTQVAGTYKSDPVSGIEDGIMRGFVNEQQANNIDIDMSSWIPDLNVSTKLSQMLRPEDRIEFDDELGWWFEYKFGSSEVEFENR